MMWSYHQPSKQTQPTCDNWTKCHKIVGYISKTAVMSVVLGLGCNLLLTGKAIAQNAPQPTQVILPAETARVNLAVNRQPEETYESLIDRAQTVAVTAVTQHFSQDRHAPAVSIMIVAHNQGAIAPVLSLEISRNQWQHTKAVTENQMKHFSNARMLLGFDGLANNTNQSQSDQLQTFTSTPQTTPETEEIDRYIRESDAKPEATMEEMTDAEAIEAPAIVPVETPTPELPTIIPGEATVPENDGSPTIPGIETPTTVPQAQQNPNPLVPTDGAVPENAIPVITDIVPEDDQGN